MFCFSSSAFSQEVLVININSRTVLVKRDATIFCCVHQTTFQQDQLYSDHNTDRKPCLSELWYSFHQSLKPPMGCLTSLANINIFISATWILWPNNTNMSLYCPQLALQHQCSPQTYNWVKTRANPTTVREQFVRSIAPTANLPTRD